LAIEESAAKRRRLEEPTRPLIAAGALHVMVEDTTPLPDYRHVMVLFHSIHSFILAYYRVEYAADDD
jgi:hypothetical protein